MWIIKDLVKTLGPRIGSGSISQIAIVIFHFHTPCADQMYILRTGAVPVEAPRSPSVQRHSVWQLQRHSGPGEVVHQPLAAGGVALAAVPVPPMHECRFDQLTVRP
jgi:hypothetical protein